MKRQACVLACLLVLGFAPRPPKPAAADPAKEVEQFEKEVKGKDAETFAKRHKELLEKLQTLHAELKKQGKAEKAEEARALGLLVRALSADHPLGMKPAGLLKKAAAGKYKHLTRVLLVPADEAEYKKFNDFGKWDGTTYADAKDLTPGYWVYVVPRWFLWRDPAK
jgi:hypothetical protein